MTLLDAQPPKPRSWLRRHAPILIVLILAVAGFLGYRFRNYTEERAVNRFLTVLQAGNYQEAYRLWQPAPSYTFQDFLRDWGREGDYGKIREFRILRSQSKGSRTVIVSVRINHVDPPLDLMVDRSTQGLAYSVF